MKHFTKFIAKTWVLLLLIGLWQFMVSFGFWPASLVASPISTLYDFQILIQNGQLWTHIWASLSRILAGLAFGTTFGILFGLIIGSLAKFKEHLTFPISVLYSIPPLAWIPFFIIGLGIGEVSKISLIALTFFVVVSVHTWEGILQTEKNYLHLAHLLEKKIFDKIVHIWLPTSTSHIMAGIKIATYYAWGILITSEIIASSSGLGYLIWNSRQFSRADDMMVAIVTIGLLGLISDFIIIQLQNKLLHWQNKTI